MAFPEDSIQYILDDWWEATTPGPSPRRGDLIKVMVPFKFGLPTRLVAKRKENQPGDHECVDFVMEQFSFESKLSREKLPISGLPDIEDGSYLLSPFKKRPALVVASACDPIDPRLTTGLAGYQKTPCFVAIPYYGVDKNGKRAGYPEPLVQAVRECRYPNFFWDCLPLRGDTESSILRIDSMQSIVDDRNYYRQTGFRLTSVAMEVMTEYLWWFLNGELPPKSLVRDLQANLKELRGI